MNYYKLTIDYKNGLLLRTENYIQSKGRLCKNSSTLERELKKIQRDNKKYFLESRIKGFKLSEITERTYNKNQF